MTKNQGDGVGKTRQQKQKTTATESMKLFQIESYFKNTN